MKLAPGGARDASVPGESEELLPIPPEELRCGGFCV